MKMYVRPWPECEAVVLAKTGLKHGFQEVSPEQIIGLVEAGLDIMIRTYDGSQGGEGHHALNINPRWRSFEYH